MRFPKLLGYLCATLLFVATAGGQSTESNATATTSTPELATNPPASANPAPAGVSPEPPQPSTWHPGELVPLLVPLGFFVSVIGIVSLILFAVHRKNRLLHETIRAMIEKGQPIPPELLKPQEPARRPGNDLRKGLVLSAIGIALLLLFSTMHGSPGVLAALGFIPLCMGIAFLIAWKIESKSKNGQG